MGEGDAALSPEEVAALMAEIGRAPSALSDAQPFTLGGEGVAPAARLAGLERIHERLARRLRGVIEPLARVKTAVVNEAAQTMRFETWRADLPAFVSLSLYRLRPLKGSLLVGIEPEFVASLVDAFYGGAGAPTAPGARTREFTPTEERLLARLADGVVERLVEVWSEVVTLAPVLAGRETNAAYASLVRGEDAVVVQRFTVTPAGGRTATLTLVYPLATLRPLEPQLSAKVHDESGPADGEWRARLTHALQDVRLPVRSVLARPELSVAQLLALKPGDVIPITLAPRVPLIVGPKRFAYGTIGERDGRAALMIDEIAHDG